MRVPAWAKAYIAGIIDGEGSICLTKNQSSTKFAVSVNMCDREAIDFIAKYYGGNIYFCDRKNEGNRRDSWKWERSHNSAAQFLIDILPYLVVKRRRAEVVLACDWSIKLTRWDGHDAERLARQQAQNKLRQLNKRGKSGK